MIGILIIPTGIGCEIGGHAGDANPAVKLIASTCDKLIVNPNAVNASDINEMPDNALYVEGSMIDRFLMREFYLQEVKSNKILVVTNPPLKNEVVNSVNAARTTIGIEAEIVVLDTPLIMIAKVNVDGSAGGIVEGDVALVKQIQKYTFDALAITTQIECLKQVSISYFINGGVNPWGAVEAIASKRISRALDKPVAHAPIESDWIRDEGYEPPITDSRMSAEMVSVSYLHCILKGLWKAPRITTNEFKGFPIQAVDIDFLVSPMCYGEPHKTCQNRGIPIIFVEENKTIYKNKFQIKHRDVIVKNYMEAAGVIQAMKEGISLDSLQRPLEVVKVYGGLSEAVSKQEAKTIREKIESPHR